VNRIKTRLGRLGVAPRNADAISLKQYEDKLPSPMTLAFIIGGAAVVMFTGSWWLLLLLACAHRTWNSNKAIRHDLYGR
jgi:hypothetical protein